MTILDQRPLQEVTCAPWCTGHDFVGECMRPLGSIELTLEEPLTAGPGVTLPATLAVTLERRDDGQTRFTMCSPGGEVFSLSMPELAELLKLGALAGGAA